MSQISVADMKPHLNVAADDAESDGIIGNYIEAAEDMVAKYVRRDLNAEFPAGWPAAILQAVRLLVAHYYENREAVTAGPKASVLPFGVEALLAAERDLGA